MKKPLILLATAASAAAVAGVVGIGVASAAPTPTPSSSSAPSASSTPSSGATPSAGKTRQEQPKKHRDLTRRALHGEVELRGTKHRVVDFQRGTVSAVSDHSVTVRSVDGYVGTYVIGRDTKLRVAKKQATVGDLSTGDSVRVVAVKDGQTLTASRVVDRRR